MKIKSTNLIGLALGDREVVAAQVSGGGRRGGRLRGWARWPLPDDGSWQRPEALGKRFGEFLKGKDLTANDAIVGVPARWLIAEAADVPPGDKATAASVLRLRAERLGGGEEQGLTFDAAGLDAAASSGGPALLVGIDAARLTQIKSFCAAAGLTPRAVTATGLAVSDAVGPDAGEALVLLGNGTELVRRDDAGRPLALRHLNGVPGELNAATLPRLSGELARALSFGSGGGTVALVGPNRLGEADYEALCERLGRAVHAADSAVSFASLPALASLNGEASGLSEDGAWPAAALAALASRNALPADFLDPALAPPPPPRFDRRVVLGVAAGLLAAVGLAMAYQSIRDAEFEAEQLDAVVKANAEDVKSAETRIEQIKFGRSFYEDRPPSLEVMSSLAAAFPPAGGIYADNVSVRADGKATVRGKARDQDQILRLQNKLIADPRFAAVELTDSRQSRAAGGRDGRGGGEDWTYTISFRFEPTPAGGSTTRPAAIADAGGGR